MDGSLAFEQGALAIRTVQAGDDVIEGRDPAYLELALRTAGIALARRLLAAEQAANAIESAPVGVRETTNGFTNLGQGFSAGNTTTLSEFGPGSGFSGVYNPNARQFLAHPSGETSLLSGAEPQNLVPLGLKGMERENKGWPDETLGSYLGEKDASVQPGDIDPAQSVVIADLGPDRLIALDYRLSEEKPRVVYLTGNEESRWVEAAPDIESLLRRLGL